MREQDERRRFEAIFASNSQRLFDYARRRTSSTADAADVMAETMLVAWRRIDEVPRGDDARLWLYGVARRVLANHRRAFRRRERLGQRLRDTVARVSIVPPERGDELDELSRALGRLTTDERELILLASWEGLDSNEMATLLGVSSGAVRVRLHRARNRLRDAMSQPDAIGTH